MYVYVSASSYCFIIHYTIIIYRRLRLYLLGSNSTQLNSPDTDTELVNWLDLPDDILFVIANKLINIKDYIRFGVVCRSWNSVYNENLRWYCPPPQIPFLMFNTGDADDYENHQTRSFYSPCERRVCNFRAALPDSMVCRGSSHGWLVIVNKDCTDIRLFNPFFSVNNQIQLPPLPLIHNEDEIRGEFYIIRAVLSANPSSNPNYVVMVQYGTKGLAFFKPGSETWSVLDLDDNYFSDVIYYNDQLYAVTWNGQLFSCDVNHPRPYLFHVAQSPSGSFEMKFVYLLVSSGELLLIKKRLYVKCSTYLTARIEIFKLDLIGSKWVELKKFCGQALFLSEASSICLSSSYFPGCKLNCIYFTHESLECDPTGDLTDFCTNFKGDQLYDMEDWNIKGHYPFKYEMKFPNPIWIEPTLRRRFN